MSRSRSVVRSQCRISSIFSSTNKARRRFSLGAIGGGPLVLKLVNPIKVARSRPANQFRIQQLLISQADSQVGTTHTAVLGKSNAAGRKKLTRFNLIDCGLNQLAKFPALLVSNRCLQILNFGCVLSYEDDQGNIGDSRHPGVA